MVAHTTASSLILVLLSGLVAFLKAQTLSSAIIKRPLFLPIVKKKKKFRAAKIAK